MGGFGTLGAGGVIISQGQITIETAGKDRLTGAVSGVSTTGSWVGIGSRRRGTAEVCDGAASFVMFVGIDTCLLETLAAPYDVESLPIIAAKFEIARGEDGGERNIRAITGALGVPSEDTGDGVQTDKEISINIHTHSIRVHAALPSLDTSIGKDLVEVHLGGGVFGLAGGGVDLKLVDLGAGDGVVEVLGGGDVKVLVIGGEVDAIAAMNSRIPHDILRHLLEGAGFDVVVPNIAVLARLCGGGVVHSGHVDVCLCAVNGKVIGLKELVVHQEWGVSPLGDPSLPSSLQCTVVVVLLPNSVANGITNQNALGTGETGTGILARLISRACECGVLGVACAGF